MLKHICMVLVRGKLIPPENMLEYIEFYVHILELNAQVYLQQKMCQGSMALTSNGANLIPSISARSRLSPHLEEAISNIYVLQQLGKTEEQFAARFLAE